MNKRLFILIVLVIMAVLHQPISYGQTGVTIHEDIAYGPASPGNLLDLYIPEGVAEETLPLLIWHSGSAWTSNDVKGAADAVDIANEFTARGFAVATISIRSSTDARFPAQGYDVRAAIRWLRANANQYGIDPDRFAFMGNSSGGWATAFAATTSDIMTLDGEQGVNGVSSAVHVAVPFFPPTDFLSMDAFAAEHDLPQSPAAYPHDAPISPESKLIHCPGEIGTEYPFPPGHLGIQECPAETESADPSSYIADVEIPLWVLHGLEDPLLPYNQSLLLYQTTTAAGNEARYTLVPSAGHSVPDIIDAAAATTQITDADGNETVIEGTGPSWDEIELFIRGHLSPDVPLAVEVKAVEADFGRMTPLLLLAMLITLVVLSGFIKRRQF